MLWIKVANAREMCEREPLAEAFWLRTLTKIFNRFSEREKRQYLRSHAPEAEKLLWNKIRRRQVADTKFRRQYGVDRFVLDFYCPELKLAIEVDGPTHKDQEEYDDIRQQFVESLGIQFLRFTNQNIYQDLEGVVNAIRKEIMRLRGG